MRKIILRIPIICALAFCLTKTCAWQLDNGDGTYKNPPLYADYPDPNIIRVGDDFYMVSTAFADSPGINVLHSKDLVNWKSFRIAPRIWIGRPYMIWMAGRLIGGGFGLQPSVIIMEYFT